MKVEKQVCTLEQAKRLRDLGVNQETSLCVWACMPDIGGDAIMFRTSPNNSLNEYSAFTVAELGVMLPINHWACFRWEAEGETGFTCNYWDCEESTLGDKVNNRMFGDTEAEARAAMLIYLLENNLTTAEEVNQRLQTA